MDGLSPNQFQSIHKNIIPIVEDPLVLNIWLYDIDIVNGNIFGEVSRRSVQNSESTVQLLRFNNHICYLKISKALFLSFLCPTCDTF